MEKACEICGEGFQPYRPLNKYCPKCKAEARRRLARTPLTTRACEICGIDLQASKSNQRYCKGCRDEARRRRQRVAKLQQPFEEPHEFKEVAQRSAPDGYKVMIVGDLHRPFQDKRTLAAVENFWNEFKPDLEIFNGDLSDWYGLSSWDQNPSRRFKLQDELDDSAAWLEERAKANPSAERILIDGNHEDRLRRFLWRHGPELSSLRALKLESLLRLDKLDIKSLTYNSVYNLLGFRIEHGFKTTVSKAYPTNVSRFMAIATGSSGLCNHTHHASVYRWTDATGSHSYIENGCLCSMNLEYAPFPNWQWSFTYGVVHNNKIHLMPTVIYKDGFRAEGEYYPR